MHKAFSLFRLISIVTTVLAGCFLLFLTAASAVSTCTIRGDYLEKTFFISSSVFPKIILLCFFAVITRIPAVRNTLHSVSSTASSQKPHRRLLLTLVLFFFSASWVLLTQPTVISDQAEIQTAAEQLNYGDLSCLRQGGYLSRYPHQAGAILISALIQRIVGRDNYLVYQLANALMAAICYYLLLRMSQSSGLSLRKPNLLFAAGLLFFPFLFYSTFVYATIPSFFLCLLSYERILRFEQSPSLLSSVTAGISMALAVFLKQNSLIFLIAAVLFSIRSAFRYGLSRLFLTVSLIFFTALSLFLPKPLLEHFTGISIPDGISPYSYLAMGIQDGDRAPGWYNMYINTIYGEAGTISEIQKENALRDFKERLAYFHHNPQDAIRFYIQKNASQWNNPTFESLWINQVRGSNIRPADWVRRLVRPTGADFLTKILNPIQFLFLFLAVLSLFYLPADLENVSFLLLITFVGGFLFHTFWEAKCQYTLPYMVLLLPFSLKGMETVFAFSASPGAFFHSCPIYKHILLVLSLFLLLILSVILVQSGFLTCDNAVYAEYLQQVRAS